jgi:hypothetical protein
VFELIVDSIYIGVNIFGLPLELKSIIICFWLFVKLTGITQVYQESPGIVNSGI